MITLYSGTPGSGKSLHVAMDIIKRISSNRNVIANFKINEMSAYSLIKKVLIKLRISKKIDKCIYIDDNELKPLILLQYARDNHKKGIEGQTLLVIDECPRLFNPREYNNPDRKDWIKFFQLHRHMGYNIILIAQNDRLIDKQIRSFLEYDVKHRKANNFKSIGAFFSLLHIGLFCAVTYWYGVHEKCGSEFFTYKKKYSLIYDSYQNF